jgi:hypothetical protein
MKGEQKIAVAYLGRFSEEMREHFTVEGKLIETWDSLKSLRHQG